MILPLESKSLLSCVTGRERRTAMRRMVPSSKHRSKIVYGS